MTSEELLEVDDLTLDEWLDLLRKRPAGKIFVANKFPTDAHKE